MYFESLFLDEPPPTHTHTHMHPCTHTYPTHTHELTYKQANTHTHTCKHTNTFFCKVLFTPLFHQSGTVSKMSNINIHFCKFCLTPNGFLIGLDSICFYLSYKMGMDTPQEVCKKIFKKESNDIT